MRGVNDRNNINVSLISDYRYNIDMSFPISIHFKYLHIGIFYTIFKIIYLHRMAENSFSKIGTIVHNWLAETLEQIMQIYIQHLFSKIF